MRNFENYIFAIILMACLCTSPPGPGWAAPCWYARTTITETFWNTYHVKTVEMLEPTVRTNRYNTFSGELAYQKTFRNDGGLLTFSYSIDGNPNSTDNNIIVKPVLNYPDYHRHSFNTEHTIPKNSLALSYTRRLGLTWRFGKTSINFKHARKTEVSDKL